MKTELQEKLYKKYPKLFVQHTESPKATCMCWGFECGDGWYWLIDQLCDSIQNYIDANKKEQTEVVQVKEKFGTLNFYTYNSDDLIQGMIWLAESISANICEACGSTEEVTQSEGWIKTRCKNCLEKQ